MKAIVSTFILLATICLSAQYNIKGKIIDDLQTPLETVVVSLYQAENKKFVKAAITNKTGDFDFLKVPTNNYYLQISSLGFENFTTESFILENNKDFKTITLTLATENLDEVVIKTEKPMVQVLADKTVFNVQNNIASTGDSGFDLLRKAPGLLIDNNENIVVEGKNGVLFYIDGKPSILRGQDLVNFLKTLQASDIESLEIITQPSSKFDAEGNAGIINIVLKRDKTLGINGSLASGFTYGKFGRYNNSVSFNNRTKKTSLYGTFSNSFGNNFGFINLYRTQNNTQFDAETESIYNYSNNNIRFGFDVYATKNSTFGVLFAGNFSDTNNNSDSRTPIINQGNTQPTEVLIANSNTNNNNYNISTNLNYAYNNKKGFTINTDIDFGKYNSDRNNLQPNYYYNGDETMVLREVINYMITPITINLFSTKIDIEQPFLKGTLSSGIKFSKVNTNNQFDFYNRVNGTDVLDSNRSNDFAYTEEIFAAYLNFNKKIKDFNVQFGFRMEHTNSLGELTSTQQNNNNLVERNYTNYFPSGGVSYTINPKNSVSFNYSKRIQRPNYQNLNPFEYKIDELSFSKGNPFLQPQYTDNIKLSHTYNYRLTTSLSYSFISDYFAQVTEAAGANQNFLITRNVANQKVYNLGISYPTKLIKWWDVYLSVNAYRSIFEATNPDFIGISQNTLSFYAQNTFKFSKTFSFEVSGWYSSPSIWGGTYRTQSLGSLNLALQKRFFDDQMTLSIAANDVLFTSPWRGTTQFGNLFINGNGGGDSRQFRINLSYNFGSSDVKKARNRNTGIDDEKSRI